jgi:hypothetical protein
MLSFNWSSLGKACSIDSDFSATQDMYMWNNLTLPALVLTTAASQLTL